MNNRNRKKIYQYYTAGIAGKIEQEDQIMNEELYEKIFKVKVGVFLEDKDDEDGKKYIDSIKFYDKSPLYIQVSMKNMEMIEKIEKIASDFIQRGNALTVKYFYSPILINNNKVYYTFRIGRIIKRNYKNRNNVYYYTNYKL